MQLKVGYFISGAVTGLILLAGFISSLPDGKLHMVFCDVGQGDATYIRFADGTDALIDGGPNDKSVTTCLGNHMPFWDRTIDLVILTHPQKDHMEGLLTISQRFRVRYFAHSSLAGSEKGQELEKIAKANGAVSKLMSQGGSMKLGLGAFLSVLWPSPTIAAAGSGVLGATTDANDTSVVVSLSYGKFDALLMGDADSHIDSRLTMSPLPQTAGLDVLKVPHHGSKTAMTEGFLQWIGPAESNSAASPSNAVARKMPLAIISVGKNSYGHPAQETIDSLVKKGLEVKRTDISGDIEITSDGTTWQVKSAK
jgi:competence protein ComEC